MGKIIDLTGGKFGRLTVIEIANPMKNTGVKKWKCVCDCGNEFIAIGSSLKNGTTISCGCSRINDLTGKRFGRLTVIKFSHVKVEGNGRPKSFAYFLCKCDCGKECIKRGSRLSEGSVNSCGCLASERRSEHYKKQLSEWNKADCKDGTRLNLIKEGVLYCTSKTGIRGVNFLNIPRTKKKYRADIKIQNKRYYLGCYDNINEAAKARKLAEEKYFNPILEKYGMTKN